MLRSLSRWFALILMTGFALLTAPAGAVTFDDGLVHVIDAANSFPFDRVEVRDGPGGATTTVEILPGGQIGTDGIDGGLNALGSSVVNMSGGSIEWSAVFIRSNSVFNMSDGAIDNALHVQDFTEVTISGGEIRSNLVAITESQLTVSGGEIRGYVRARSESEVMVSGGMIGNGSLSVEGDGSSLTTITGGIFSGRLNALESASHFRRVLGRLIQCPPKFYRDNQRIGF